MTSLVVDAGRLHWFVGRAGEDSPDACPNYDTTEFPGHGDESLLKRREANWQIFEESLVYRIFDAE